jgi:hypothetical protein
MLVKPAKAFQSLFQFTADVDDTLNPLKLLRKTSIKLHSVIEPRGDFKRVWWPRRFILPPKET